MTDHLHPEPEPTAEALLASAFVDGVLTPAEQAEVEQSPDTQALAQSFLEVRGALSAPLVVDDTVRESAIAAALAEFDTLRATPAVAASAAPVAPVIALAGRRRWPTRVMTAAAAVMVFGVAGVAVFGGDDSKDSTADDARTMSAEVMAGNDTASTIGAINGAASYAIPITDPLQLLELPMPEALPTVAGDGSTAGVTLDSTTADAAPGGSDAKYALPGMQCLTGDQVFLAQILYQDTPAIAARDTVTGVTQAIDEQCNVLVEVAP